MSKRKEKYYNFIIDDMVSKTEIDYERKEIKFPFIPTKIPYTHYEGVDKTYFAFGGIYNWFSIFENYVGRMYGVQIPGGDEIAGTSLYEDEVKKIWFPYNEKLDSIIRDEH